MNWQPMETAPKDGTIILACKEEDITSVYWSKLGWRLSVGRWFSDSSNWNPTHWMPLPAPPSEEK